MARTWQCVDERLQIKLPEIFDFEVNLDYLTRDTNECMYEVRDNHVTRLIELDNHRLLIQISAEDNKYLNVSFLAGTYPDETLLPKVVDYVWEWFDLDYDLAAFYEMSRKDPLLSQAIEKEYGLRLMGINELLETLCWAILGQQINLTFAYTLKRRFVETFGESMEYEGKKYMLFPSAETIAGLTPEDMADVKMTRRKSEYIINVARLIRDNQLTKEALLELDSLDAIERELTKIRGIGPWTANYVSMRCLRHPSSFPVADVGLMNAVKFGLDMDRKPTQEELLELSKKWSGFESYATFYLWRLLY